ncbi:hypothetical protein KBG23_02850 [Candidatus Dojkabacteria bacterium]|jgi:hypothetical protein|nr:hypothetical protein [Candidatus Dojkabacteria bacterium]
MDSPELSTTEDKSDFTPVGQEGEGHTTSQPLTQEGGEDKRFTLNDMQFGTMVDGTFVPAEVNQENGGFVPLPRAGTKSEIKILPYEGGKSTSVPLGGNVDYRDIGKPYSFFREDGAYVSEGMRQMYEDLRKQQESTPTEREYVTNESEKRNLEIIEILKNEPKFEGAFRQMKFSDGEEALIFERGVFASKKKELTSSVGISEEFSSPKNLSEAILYNNSFIMLTKRGMIYSVIGGVFEGRPEEDYETIYRHIISKGENSKNLDGFQTKFSNVELFPDRGFTNEGQITDREGNVISSEKDTNFYWAMFMKDGLNDKIHGVNLKGLLKEFAEASNIAKQEKLARQPISSSDLKSMIDEI